MDQLNSQAGVSALQFMNLTANDDGDEYLLRPRALCADGFSISIQGGNRFHYCQPRKLCRIFESVELGFPNQVDDSIMRYIDGPESNPLESAYGYVPIEIVDALVAKHGGIVDIDTGTVDDFGALHLSYYMKCQEAVRRGMVYNELTKTKGDWAI